jgi:hypothetical protein
MRHAQGLMIGVVLLVAGGAGAQQESVAETLFRAGREEMKQGAYASACPKFAESQRLDPSPGTLLNLAVCEEGLGLVATAWARFRALLDTLDPADPRARIAREHAQALEPTLPRLQVRFEPAAPPGVVIRLDGAVLGGAAQGLFMPIDPGEHRLEVSDALGSIHNERFRIALGDRLERALSPRPAAGAARPSPPTRERVPSKDARADGPSPLPLVGLATAGAGIAAIGVGAFFALDARSLNEESNAGGRCDGNRCDPTGTSLRNAALTKADIATVLFGAGAALGVGGASLFFVTRRSENTSTHVAIRATWVGHLGLNASGAF